MSEVKTAKLITLHHSSDVRILKEIEGSNCLYYCGPNESSRSVSIRQATIALLKEELGHMGIVIEDVPTIQRVANKFSTELAKKLGGKLAIDYDFGLGLCEILS